MVNQQLKRVGKQMENRKPKGIPPCGALCGFIKQHRCQFLNIVVLQLGSIITAYYHHKDEPAKDVLPLEQASELFLVHQIGNDREALKYD